MNSVTMRMRGIILTLACLGLSVTADANPIVYGFSFTNPANFGTFDISNGQFVQIGPALPDPLNDIAVDPLGQVYAIDSLTGLVTIDSSTGAETQVGPTVPGLQSIAFRPDGTLFGASASDLYTVDPSTGTSVDLGIITQNENFDNIRFEGGVLFGMTTDNSSLLFRIDESTGSGVLVGASAVPDVSLGVFQNGLFYGSNSDSNGNFRVVTVDPVTGVASESSFTTPDQYIFATAPEVPEPFTAGLMTLGLAGLFFLRRSRTKNPI